MRGHRIPAALTDGTTSDVVVSGDSDSNILGFTYDASAGEFLAANNSWDWLTITAGGVSTEVNTYGGTVSRGLAFVVPEPSSLAMLVLNGLTLGMLGRRRKR